MPLASLFNLQFYGPGSGATVVQASAEVISQATGVGSVASVVPASASVPLADATRLVNSPAVINGSAVIANALPKARARANAIIKVGQLTQDDVTGAVLEAQVESGFSLKQILRLMSAVILGRASGGPGSPVFRDVNNTKDRVTGTADSNGNRTAATYDPD
jgi:hypothetical protein